MAAVARQPRMFPQRVQRECRNRSRLAQYAGGAKRFARLEHASSRKHCEAEIPNIAARAFCRRFVALQCPRSAWTQRRFNFSRFSFRSQRTRRRRQFAYDGGSPQLDLARVEQEALSRVNPIQEVDNKCRLTSC